MASVLRSVPSRRQMVQRMGRVIRRKTDGRRARFVVGYIRATIEDPAFGAHESFLEEVTTVADHVHTCNPTVDGWSTLIVLLSPGSGFWVLGSR